MITLAECYIQIWKLNKNLTREQRVGEEPMEFGQTVAPGHTASNLSGQSHILSNAK